MQLMLLLGPLCRLAFVPDRNGVYLLLADTTSSLILLLTGISLAATAGLFVGIHIALFPGIRALIEPILIFMSNVPPLALSPIL
jgi:NitT/TauT family transport system permease protein